MGGKTPGKRVALPIAGLVVVILILGSVLWFVPQWQAARVHTGQDGKPITDVERFEVENKARGSLIQGIAGLGGAFFFLTAYFTWRNLQVTEDKQVSERFVKAAEMMAAVDEDNRPHEKLAVRVAGIYALERIANDSPDDYWTVMEVLTFFIRNQE
jgi:hypothetical protein